MKITEITTYATKSVTLVCVRAEDGVEGWGQTAPFSADITAQVLHRHVAPHVIGRDETEIEAICQDVVEREYKFPGSYVCRALTGVETGLWDLRAKRANVPVCALLGGPQAPKPVPAYGSSMRRDIKPHEEGERLARLRDSLGYKAFKIRIGSVCGHDKDEWPGRTEEIIPEVRRAVGGDCALMGDANSCYTPGRAFEVGKLLEAANYHHFEEPCPYWELEWTAEVAHALTVPVAGGEQDTDLAQFRRMIGTNAVDIVQPDVCYIGGMTRARAVAQMAAEAGKMCTPHSANRTLVTVFTMHLLAAIENAGPYMEFSIEPGQWSDSLFDPPLKSEAGVVAFPSEGPGWGVRVREDWLAAAHRQASPA